MYEKSAKGKNEYEKKVIHWLLLKHQNVFSKNENDLGCMHLVEHTIDTGDAKPIKQPPRKLPMAFANDDRKALEKLQTQGVIWPSTSPWALANLLVKKKDGSTRPCVDYHRLNAVTRNDAYPVPRAQDCLDSMAGSGMFSTIDILSAYNQVPVAEEDIPKTAFSTKYGLFEFTTMPFGLMTAPATYQRLMELTLSGLQWSLCLIYLDDVIVFSEDFDEQVDRLDQVLTHIGSASLKLKPSKCVFFATKVSFLGHNLSKEGILPDPENMAKILNWPVPKTVRDVRGILGLGSYYCHFIRNFSERVQPLVNLTKKDKPFKWTEECQSAFEDIKQVLISPDIMAFQTDDGQFILDSDASDETIGAVFMQIQSGVEKVIAYGSQTLGKADRNYCATD